MLTCLQLSLTAPRPAGELFVGEESGMDELDGFILEEARTLSPCWLCLVRRSGSSCSAAIAAVRAPDPTSLVDTTSTGFPPNTFQRFLAAVEWRMSAGSVCLAMVALEEMIDPRSLGDRRRQPGLMSNIFTNEAEVRVAQRSSAAGDRNNR